MPLRFSCHHALSYPREMILTENVNLPKQLGLMLMRPAGHKRVTSAEGIVYKKRLARE
jgi:hypothetical protein